MAETAELTTTDRLAFCIVKANCSGPSTRTSNRGQDMWTCQKCHGWSVVRKGEVPVIDSRKAGR